MSSSQNFYVMCLRNFSRIFLREFQIHYRRIDHDKPEEFSKSQWQGNSDIKQWIYLVYRWLLAAFLICCLVISLFLDGSGIKWPIYMTNWGFSILVLQAILASSLATDYKFGNIGYSMSLLHKTYWVLNTLANSSSVLITVGYWATVYKPETHPLNFVNLTTHMFNTIIVIFDTLIAGHPIRLFHAYQHIIFALVYLIFTAIYYVAGGTDKDGNSALYGVLLNWNRPHWTILYVLLSGVFLMFVHFLFWLLYLLRRKMAKLLLCEVVVTPQQSEDIATYVKSEEVVLPSV